MKKILVLLILTLLLQGCFMHSNVLSYEVWTKKNDSKDYGIAMSGRLLPEDKFYWIPPTVFLHRQKKEVYYLSLDINFSPTNRDLDSLFVKQVQLIIGDSIIFSDAPLFIAKDTMYQRYSWKPEMVININSEPDSIFLYLEYDTSMDSSRFIKLPFHKKKDKGWELMANTG